MSVEADLSGRLARHPEVQFAFLFGSRASNRHRPGSDWDIAVYLDDALSPRETFETRLQLLGDLEDLGEMDLVILNQAPPLLGHRALQGKRLMVRDPRTYIRYFQRTLAESEDERHWRWSRSSVPRWKVGHVCATFSCTCTSTWITRGSGKSSPKSWTSSRLTPRL